MARTPSLLRIVQVDYLASLGVLIPVVIWGLVLLGLVFDPGAASFFRLIAPAATAAGLILLLWRVMSIRAVFNGGDEVPGVIVGAGFVRGRGRIQYVYTYRGRKYLGSSALQASAITRALVPGRAVTVMVDPLKPRRAFVCELYL
jgi:hypothetical protein